MTGVYADFAFCCFHVHDSISGRQPIARNIVFGRYVDARNFKIMVYFD